MLAEGAGGELRPFVFGTADCVVDSRLRERMAGGGMIVGGCVVVALELGTCEVDLTERSRAGVLAAVSLVTSSELPLVIKVYCATMPPSS